MKRWIALFLLCSCSCAVVHEPACLETPVFESRCETEPVAPWCLDCNPCTRDFSCADYPEDPACCWREGCVSVPYREGEGCSVTFGGVGVCVAGECIED